MNIQAFGSGDSGCSDMICAGFVQVTQDTRFFLGSVMSLATRIGAPTKYHLEFKIQRVNFLRNIKNTYTIILYLRNAIVFIKSFLANIIFKTCIISITLNIYIEKL
jgi:hypothetical protein